MLTGSVWLYIGTISNGSWLQLWSMAELFWNGPGSNQPNVSYEWFSSTTASTKFQLLQDLAYESSTKESKVSLNSCEQFIRNEMNNVILIFTT